MARNNRDMFAAISPPWLQGPFGERLMGTLGLVWDLMSEAATQAVKVFGQS